MTKPARERRRKYYIKKRFQGLFVIKVILALLLGLVLSMAVLLYLAGNSLTAEYSRGSVSIKPTADAISPYIFLADGLSGVLVVVVVVLIALIFSHRVAGPLYRFEKSIGVIKTGELTHRVHLRDNDHLKEMKEEINLLAEFFDHRIGAMKDAMEELSSLIKGCKEKDEKEKQAQLREFEEKIDSLNKHMSVFKTTKKHKPQH